MLGILFANITAFAQPRLAYGWPPAMAVPATWADSVVWVFQLVFVDGKFRGLFTILFGAGLALFDERARARHAGAGLQRRRLAILLGFGLAHYFLLWRGDILTLYAVWGFVGLAAREAAPRSQLALGLIAYGGGSLLLASLYAAGWTAPGAAALERQILAEAARETALYRTAGWTDLVAWTWTEQGGALLDEIVWAGLGETIGLIWIGMGLYRLGAFGPVAPRWRRRAWIAVAAGTLVTVPLALWPPGAGFPFGLTQFVANGLAPFPRLPVLLGLVPLLAQGARAIEGRAVGARLAACGRMAFSNYIGTSLVMAALFDGWGLGLYGRIGRAGLLPFVVLGWALMLAWSAPWLGAFRYGPLEWLWRCLTYGRVVPMRRVRT